MAPSARFTMPLVGRKDAAVFPQAPGDPRERSSIRDRRPDTTRATVTVVATLQGHAIPEIVRAVPPLLTAKFLPTRAIFLPLCASSAEAR